MKKRQHPFVAQARAHFRVARKFEKNGNPKQAEWHQWLAQRKLLEFHRAKAKGK